MDDAKDDYTDPCAKYREHKYIGGPPIARIRTMQSTHEVRARKAGVEWEMVDLRVVYRLHNGICGICHKAVSLHEFTIDHIIPLSRGGPHMIQNLQVAHAGCNSSKGNR